MNVNDFEAGKEKANCNNIDFQAFSREEEFKNSFWGVINEINEAINFHIDSEGILNTSLEKKIPSSYSLLVPEENTQDEHFESVNTGINEKEEPLFNSRFTLINIGER